MSYKKLDYETVQKDIDLLDFDALLADLQNSVPGQQNHHQNFQHANMQHNQMQHIQNSQNDYHYNNSNTSGYGSLNTGRATQSPQSPTYQNQVTQQRIINESRASSSPGLVLNGAAHQIGYNPPPVRPTESHHQSTLSRSNTPQQNNAGNLSELDSLLQDLSTARYGNVSEKKVDSYHVNGAVSPSHNVISESMKRPSVDSLLDELSNAHNVGPIYAVPNGVSSDVSPGQPHGGKQVTITVRETKTEKVTGSPSSPQPANTVHQQQVTQTRHNVVGSVPGGGPYATSASSATKELDDLMASLSDFKVNSGSHQLQTVTDYAKPNKGTAHFHSTQQTTVTTTTTATPPEQERPDPDQLDSMLGNLQADMSRKGVNTTQKGCCTSCEKPIVGQVITALGKTWHPEHFTCNHCAQELGTRNFFERDGNPYCEPDYHNLFSPRCAYCNGPILDKCVTALDKTWHTEHFFCAQCGQQFGEDGFHERDGKPYCKNDYFDQFAPKCNGCNRAIMENYISALNSQWHPDCFVCRDCKKPVRGKSFYAMEGRPVCPTCAGVDEDD